MNKTNASDHDLLIRIDARTQAMEDSLTTICNKVELNTKRIDVTEDWQRDWDTKSKFAYGVAVFVGGAFLFIITRVWDFFSKKI